MKMNEGVPLKKAENNDDDKILSPIVINEDEKSLIFVDSVLSLAEERGPKTPSLEEVKYYTLTESSYRIMEKLATAVELRDPCLLEGDTGTSKTSSIKFLAALTGHQLERINFTGSSDSSELIGKYVPNNQTLQAAFDDLLKSESSLRPETRAIIDNSRKEKRGLTEIENAKIAAIEDIDIPEWRWQDGKLPYCMKNGVWLILDEVNLAEPDVIERINSVLERNPSLTLTENGGMTIAERDGDIPLHPDFRIFATMNPASFAGRNAMSPAGKDRWTSFINVPNADREDYHAMLRHSIFGVHPKVEMHGHVFQQERNDPAFPDLMEVPGMEQFLEVFSDFQIRIEKMSREREIGKGRTEKYIFTRRSMFEFIEFINKKRVIDRSTGEMVGVSQNPKEIILRGIQYYYLDKIADKEDYQKVLDVMSTLGISREEWSIDMLSDEQKQIELARAEARERFENELKEEGLSIGSAVRSLNLEDRGISRIMDLDAESRRLKICLEGSSEEVWVDVGEVLLPEVATVMELEQKGIKLGDFVCVEGLSRNKRLRLLGISFEDDGLYLKYLNEEGEVSKIKGIDTISKDPRSDEEYEEALEEIKSYHSATRVIATRGPLAGRTGLVRYTNLKGDGSLEVEVSFDGSDGLQSKMDVEDIKKQDYNEVLETASGPYNFRGMNGRIIKVEIKESLGGMKFGDRYKMTEEKRSLCREEIQRSSSVTYVGTHDDDPVFSLDDGTCYMDRSEDFPTGYEKI